MRYLIAKVFAACCALDAGALGLLWNEMTTTIDQEKELLATWSHLSPQQPRQSVHHPPH